MVWIAIIVAVSCRGDQQMAYLSRSLIAYDEGQAALAAESWELAATEFQRAVQSDPTRPVLRDWHALALDKGGQTQEAIEVLNEAVRLFPHAVDVRYNRAALAARTGAIFTAHDDLLWLYEVGGVDPTQVALDPDFLSLSTHPQTEYLVPPVALKLVSKSESGSVLRGELIDLELELESLQGASLISVGNAPPTEFASHVRTVEDLIEVDGRWAHRHVVVQWRSLQTGSVTMGPWTVSAHGSSASIPSMNINVIDVDRIGSEVGRQHPAILFPSSTFSDKTPPWMGRMEDGRVAILYTEQMAVRFKEPMTPQTQLEYREAGQNRWRVDLYEWTDDLEVEVGQEVFRVPPDRE